MVIVADSGSTKTDWLVLESGKIVKEFNTIGFNPIFHDREAIVKELEQVDDLPNYKNQIDHIYFYGPMCSSTERCEKIASGLRGYFDSDAMIKVDHDLSAAVYATCGNEPGITAILGTGSNACYFNGKTIRQDVPSLGYFLGDEGSGCYIGRHIIKRFLYKQVPEWLELALRQDYLLTKEKVFQHVYFGHSNPNVYLASFAKVLSNKPNDAFTKEILDESFGKFVEYMVEPYAERKDVPIHFVGSIAYYFKDALKRNLDAKGLTMGKVLHQPVYNLAEYHLSHNGASK